jgi:hypothetical protein
MRTFRCAGLFAALLFFALPVLRANPLELAGPDGPPASIIVPEQAPEAEVFAAQASVITQKRP